jgi:DNA-binding transcriptional LysR family regulator
MELRHLKYFCAVAQHKSFSIAARHLNVSQSGVSGQVQDLERELGFPLLRRNKRAVALTAEGIVFYDEAKDILARASRAVEMASQAAKGESGHLTVGLCGPVTAPFLPKLIRTFRIKHPAVKLSIRERLPSEQLDALLNGVIDIGFTRGVRAEIRHLIHHELLFREPIVAAIARSHPLSKLDTVPVRRLAREPLLLYWRDAAPEIYDTITSLCQKARFSPRVADTPRSWQSLLTMVEAEEGIGLIPHCVQYLRSDDIVFRPLNMPCHVDALVVWRAESTSRLQQSFLDLLQAKKPELQKTVNRK